MHRFQPRIYLVIRPEDATGPIVDLEKEFYRSYIFPETIFTAVTAYQNQLVKKKNELAFSFSHVIFRAAFHKAIS